MNLPAAHLAALVITTFYGLVSLAGGIIGYVKAGSLPSLIAGGICGILLLACAASIARWPTGALIGAIVISLALLGRFLPGFLKNPSLSTGASITALVMTVGGVATVVAAAVALAVRSKGA